MELRTLITFQMIVKHGSFIRAAKEMNYVQSTVTMQIQKLESELGVSLIERGKEIRLTEAGRLFYDQSIQIVKHIEQLQTSISDLRLGETGHIRIGVTEPTASYRLPGILKKFMSAYPNIRISLEISNTSVLSERVRAGDLDFALSTTPDMGTAIDFEPLFQEEFVAFMLDNHPLAQKRVIIPEDLQGYRLLITSDSCPYRKKLEVVLQEKGNVTLDTMEIGSMTALKFYVENGLGIALVPKIMVEPLASGTTVRKISGSLIHMAFGIMRRASANPFQRASQKLYQYLQQELVTPAEL